MNANHSNYPDVVTLDLKKKKRRRRKRKLRVAKRPGIPDSTVSMMENK